MNNYTEFKDLLATIILSDVGTYNNAVSELKVRGIVEALCFVFGYKPEDICVEYTSGGWSVS